MQKNRKNLRFVLGFFFFILSLVVLSKIHFVSDLLRHSCYACCFSALYFLPILIIKGI